MNNAFVGIALAGSLLTGCTNLLADPQTTKTGIIDVQPQPDLARQSLCDVERSRAREDLLKRIDVDQFSAIALKVSQAFTADEIDDLKSLFVNAEPPTEDWELDHQRDDLVGQIYADAIARSGLKSGAPQSIGGGPLSYLIDPSPVSAGNGAYTEFLVGKLGKDLGPVGSIAQVGLAATPDQTRYYVDLYLLSRYDQQSDGTQNPIFTTESLYESAADEIPRSCDGANTALDLDQFNTISAP